MLLHCCFLVEISLIRKENCYTFFLQHGLKAKRVVRRQQLSQTSLLLPSPSHLFNRARLGGWPERSALTFEGGVGPPARVLYQKFNVRPMLQCNPDLENEPIELAQILHAAPI